MVNDMKYRADCTIRVDGEDYTLTTYGRYKENAFGTMFKALWSFMKEIRKGNDVTIIITGGEVK